MITGSLDSVSLARTLSHMPECTWELVTHPGYHDADLDSVRTRLKASREIERQALKAIVDFPKIELINFESIASNGTDASIGS
jgi:hypothetical protein